MKIRNWDKANLSDEHIQKIKEIRDWLFKIADDTGLILSYVI